MTGNRSQLMNFFSKFLGTVRFENDHIARIIGYGDYQLGNVTISRVYYVEGLGHNLFSVGQFCDADLEVAFRKNTCFIRNLEGVDLISGSRDTNLYTISLDDMLKTSSICLLSKASKTKRWLWHRRLSHLNFACALGKSKKSSHQPKAEDTNQEKLYLLHMDLCVPMRVASINGKRYILVIVDDYSRFTWVRFLRTKDEALEAIIKCIKCIKNIQVRLNAIVRNVRTDNGTEFVNQTLRKFYENVSISHQTSVARTPQQNGIALKTWFQIYGFLLKLPMINMHYGEYHIEESNVEVMRKHGYGYLKEIVVRRADNDLYRFKEGDFPRLRINDIEHMLLLVVQNWLTNLSADDIFDFTIALRMFTRSLVIQKRVEDL
ncbi:retrovirus-related pol polyprotein from transposon TNT 1-94 [Tanacetum coccineum]